MLREVIEWIDLQPGMIVVDATVGGGGHAAAMAERIEPNGTLIACDRDPLMLQMAATRLSVHLSIQFIHSSYALLPTVLAQMGCEAVDRIFVDLGVSSDQLADNARFQLPFER